MKNKIIIFIFGSNEHKITNLCFFLKYNIFKFSKKTCAIVHPLEILNFYKYEKCKNENEKNNLKSVYCYNRVREILKENDYIIINNYIRSLKEISNLLYNFNLLKTPITHFICDNIYCDKISEIFNNFLIIDFKNTNSLCTDTKNYIFFENYKDNFSFKKYDIINEKIMTPNKFFLIVLYGYPKFRIIFNKLKHLVSLIFHVNFEDNFDNVKTLKDKINMIISNKNERFFALFNFKKRSYLIDLADYSLFVVSTLMGIKNFINRCYFILELNQTNFDIFDFKIVKFYQADGSTFVLNNKNHFEKGIISIKS